MQNVTFASLSDSNIFSIQNQFLFYHRQLLTADTETKIYVYYVYSHLLSVNVMAKIDSVFKLPLNDYFNLNFYRNCFNLSFISTSHDFLQILGTKGSCFIMRQHKEFSEVT